jgi:flagella basal body P-ring formation protein FlgA
MKRVFLGLSVGLFLTGVFQVFSGYAAEFSEDEIKGRIVNYMTAHTPWTQDQIEISRLTISPQAAIPQGPVRFEIKPAPRSSLIGKSDFSLKFLSGEKEGQTLWVSAMVKVWVDTLLAAHGLKGGDVIREEDVYVGKRDLAELPPDALSDPSEAVGMRATRFVGANLPLIQDNLRELPVFERGARILIVAESDSLRIFVLGEAKEDGYRGRLARVTNLQSRKEVSGEVQGDGKVRVQY